MSYIVSPTPIFAALDTTTQAVAVANQEQVITYNTVDFAKGITLVTSGGKASRITFQESSFYLVIFSAVCNSTSGNRLLQVWLKKNGVNVANTNTQIGVANTSIPSVLTVNFMIDAVVNDYIELWMTGDSTAAQISAVAAQAGPPAIPAMPSIIMTVNKISR